MLNDPGTRLRNAVAVGKLLIVKRILSRFPDLLDIIDPTNGWSLLHYASYHGRYLTCVYLVQLGHGKKEILRTFQGNTCVHLALLNGHEQTAHLLLQHFPYCLNIKGHHGRTPVQMTCQYDHYQCLSLLLGLGADLSVRDEFGNTALHICLIYGSENCMRMLVREEDMEDQESLMIGKWGPTDLCQTFELAEMYQKALREKRTRSKLTKRPSYQFMISPLTIPKPVFENSGSPLLSNSPAVQSFTSQLPPLPKISTSRRTSVGSQSVWSPKTPAAYTLNSNASNSPSKKPIHKPSMTSQPSSASSASLPRRDSGLSMNSSRNKSNEHSVASKYSQTSTAAEPLAEKSNSTISITSSENTQAGNSSTVKDSHTRLVSPRDSSHTSRGSIGSPKPEKPPGKTTPLSLLNIPISKLRNRD